MNGFIPRAATLAFLATFVAGCVTTSTSLLGPKDPPPSAGTALQVHALWENRVITVPDVVNQGRPLAGLAGRVYLFGEKFGLPVAATGSVTVDLHELKPDGKVVMLERWEIDPKTLERLGRRDDGIGWGYTVFLPWSTFRPEVNRVQIQVKFVPEKGIPIFSQPSAVTLNREEFAPPTITSQVVPVGAKK